MILNVVHHNYLVGDDRPEYLRAWCQWCHLHHEVPHHAKTRATRKDRTRELLAEEACA